MADFVTKATLGGRPLMASAAVTWDLTTGTAPSIKTFDLLREDADALMAAARAPVELVITHNDRVQTVQNLWVIANAPADTPFHGRVTVADRRWFWQYAHVIRRYNMRRRTGGRRIKSNLPGELQPVAPTVQYRPWSLKTPDAGIRGRWVAREVIEDVVKEAGRGERDHVGTIPTVSVSSDLGRTLPIDRLQIDDPGDAAVGRALGYLPEAAITIDEKGNAIVFSRASGAEQGLIEKNLGPEVQGRGHLEVVKNAAQRPKEVRIWFTREPEVRFDFLEAAQAEDTVAPGDARVLENVLPVPDFQITISGETVPQGTWVTFDAYLSAISGEAKPGGSSLAGTRIDHNILERSALPHVDLWGALGLLGTRDPDADWAARIGALQRHWRRTFRINRKWVDRVLKISAYRIATIDQVSGQRGPAEAYADYTLVPGRRFHWKRRSAVQSMYHSIAKRGYPQGATQSIRGQTVNRFDANTKAAPADVSVVDEDQGIIDVEFLVDPNRLHEKAIPGILSSDAIPQWDLRRQEDVPITFDHLIALNRPVKMSPQWKLAVILTVAPAAPNGLDQLHRVTVKPADLSGMVPAGALQAATGPPMDVRIGANVETARFRWSDESWESIEEFFGLPAKGDPKDKRDVSERTRFLCVNDGREDSGAASLWDIARAAASRVYASLADHYEGRAAVELTPGLVPSGWITRISHSLDTRGVATTEIELPASIPQIDLVSYLPDSARAIILREVPG